MLPLTQKSTYKLLVSTWELSINDPNLAHVSETVDDLHHDQPGGIHPPTRHCIQPTPFPSRNATLGTVGVIGHGFMAGNIAR